MSAAWGSAFPQDTAVLGRAGGQIRLAARAGPATPSLVLLAPDVDPSAVDAAARAGALVIEAARVFALLAPERRSLPEAPEALLGLYNEAAARHPPRSGLVRLALEALPAAAAAERRLLAQALAACASLVPRRAAVPPPIAAAPAASLLGPAALETAEPHALLDACYAAFAAWRGSEFEARPGQLEMSHAVLETLLSRGSLVVEAGTGTGKSLAYALPGVVFALVSGRRVVVSTHTRTLQAQLLRRELPLLGACFGLGTLPRGDGRRGLRWVKLLGRTNYICQQALEGWVERCSAAGGSLEAAQVVLAVLRSADGVLEAPLPEVPAALRSRRESCGGRACRAACPVYMARETARSADLLVVNHALLCADAQLDGSLLGDGGALVVDEAHALERVAREALSLHLGTAQVEVLGGMGHRLAAETQAIALLAPLVWERLPAVVAATSALRTALQQLLAQLDALLPRTARRRRRQRYRDPDEVFGAARAAVEALQTCLAGAGEALLPFLESCRTNAVSVPDVANVLEAAELLGGIQEEIAAAFARVRQGGEEEWVTHLDFSAPDKGLREIVATPLDVGPALQRLLVEAERGVVYTSATLHAQGDASYVRRALGVPREARELCLPSPFDFERQCTVVCTEALGDYRAPEFVPALAAVVEALHRRTQRRLLVLLTSHSMLRALHAELATRLGAGAPLLAQGMAEGREALAARFASLPAALLLGTNSFWEGMDFPGEALEILVLAKLPFAVPADPYVEARCERLRAYGEDAFGAFLLPEAVLRFRQGFGRLIRAERDRGAVLLLDGRLSTRAYGAEFFAALPVRVLELDSAAALVAHVESWFAAGPS